MAAYDVRYETWLFESVGTADGQKIWRRKKFNLVNFETVNGRYGADGYLEPVNDVQFTVPIGQQATDYVLLDKGTQLPKVVKFEFFDGDNANPWSDLQRFD